MHGLTVLLGAVACQASTGTDETEAKEATSAGATQTGTGVAQTSTDVTSAAADESSSSPTSGVDGDSSSESGAVPDGTTGEPSSLQYFGFVGVHCGLDDPHDADDKTVYVDEVAGFTNVAHVCPLDLDISPQLTTVVASGNRALLDLTGVLFEPEPGSPPSGNPDRLALASNVAEVWSAFVTTNADVLNTEHIAAIYVVDEPVWNGVHAEELEAAVALVDAEFPDIPLLVVEAYPVVDAALFPAGVDWVGFDRYFIPDPSTDADYLADLATVRQRARADQSLVLILDSQWFPFYEKIPLSQADMETVAQRYYDLALSEPDVVALIGYSWAGGIDGDMQFGARDLPASVIEAYQAIGNDIVGR